MKHLRFWRVFSLAVLIVALATASAFASTSSLTFAGDFANGSILPFVGAQCANYGVESANYHQRGTLAVENNIVAMGSFSGRVDLPANVSPYTTSVCELLHSVPVGLGTDQYYGYMFYVPQGWDTGTKGFWGVQVAQFHFTNVWGSPIAFQLHDDHMTLALETGACYPVGSPSPGCTWRSQADLKSGPNMPGYYVIPPGSMPQGHWYEIAMHVHWATDSTGQIQTWYRQKGQTAWIPTASVSGIPTVQWAYGYPPATYAVDKVGAYRAYSTVPISVWFDHFSLANTKSAITSSMP
jgi:hypothetical protein